MHIPLVVMVSAYSLGALLDTDAFLFVICAAAIELRTLDCRFVGYVVETQNKILQPLFRSDGMHFRIKTGRAVAINVTVRRAVLYLLCQLPTCVLTVCCRRSTRARRCL